MSTGPSGPNPVQSAPTDPNLLQGGGGGASLNLNKLALVAVAPVTGMAIEKVAGAGEAVASGVTRQGAGNLISAMRKLPLKIPLKIPFLKV